MKDLNRQRKSNIERAARDPETDKTVYVDGSQDYGEWNRQFVEVDEKGHEFTLTSFMKAAQLRYVSPESIWLNDKLCCGDELTAFEKKWIMDLDEALEYNPDATIQIYGGQ